MKIYYIALGLLFYVNHISAQLQFNHHIVSRGDYCQDSPILPVDLDSDGDIDLLTVTNNKDSYAKQDSAKLIWYKNDGHGNFMKYTITDTVFGVGAVYASDLDEDNDMDLLAIFYRYEKFMGWNYRYEYIVWLENDGMQGFTANILKYLVEDIFWDYLKCICTFDIENDGDNDIVACRERSGLMILENDGKMNFFNQYQFYFNSTSSIKNVIITDFDADNYTDLLAAEKNEVAWYVNDYVYNNAVVFERYPLATNLCGASSACIADMDNDGDDDILSNICEENKIIWLDCPDNIWNIFPEELDVNIIDHNIQDPRSVHAIDIDADDDMDVLSVSYLDNKILWYENDGSQNFSQHIISDSALGANFVYAVDMDNDQDFDVLAASLNDSTIRWYENLTPTDIMLDTSDPVYKDFQLYDNYPNPFNNATIINYQLPRTSEVELSIYNIVGQKVKTLVSEKQPAGNYKVEWDATGFASGVYMYQLTTNRGFTQTKKMVLLR